MSWLVYMIQSSTGRLYTGATNNFERRLRQHNEGRGAKATRAGRPWRKVFSSECADRGAALRLEAQIKKLTRAKKLELVAIFLFDNPTPKT